MTLPVIAFETLQTEDAGDRPMGHYDEFGFMVDGGIAYYCINDFSHTVEICYASIQETLESKMMESILFYNYHCFYFL